MEWSGGPSGEGRQLELVERGAATVDQEADVAAPRSVPDALHARRLSHFSSVEPVFVPLAGMLILGQWLSLHEWLGIVIIVVANEPSPPGGRDTERDRDWLGSLPRRPDGNRFSIMVAYGSFGSQRAAPSVFESTTASTSALRYRLRRALTPALLPSL